MGFAKPGKMFPSQHGAVVLSGTSTEDAVKFGFNATYIQVNNLGTTCEAYLNFGSTEPATTSDLPLVIGGTIEIPHLPQCAGIGLATGSTSTSDVLKRISVIALG